MYRFLLPPLLTLILSFPATGSETDWAAVREEASVLLSRYVAIPSISGNEGEAADFLEAAAKARGFNVFRFLTTDNRPNLYITTGVPNGTPPKLILLSHIDVVPAPSEGWTHPPFSGARVGGAIWGRGALDNKGMTVMHLLAVHLLKKVAPEAAAQIAILSVSDEEVDGLGATAALEKHPELLGKAPVLGEGGTGLVDTDPVPKGMALYPVTSAEKSGLWLKLILDIATSGHGSVPPEEYASRNMTMALQRLLKNKLPARIVPEAKILLESLARYLDFPKNFFLAHPTWPLIQNVLQRILSTNPLTSALIRDTITLTGITTETAIPNIIPKRVVALLDCRLLPGTKESEFLKQVVKLLKEPQIKIEVLHRTPNTPGSTPDTLMLSLKQALEAEDPKAIVTPGLFPASSDGSLFRAAGHQVFGLLPCRLTLSEIEGIHGRDERMREECLEMGIRVLLRAFRSFLAKDGR